jgi:hypothetical protein
MRSLRRFDRAIFALGALFVAETSHAQTPVQGAVGYSFDTANYWGRDSRRSTVPTLKSVPWPATKSPL